MPKVAKKQCLQCTGCRAPECKNCSNCLMKKACSNKICTGQPNDDKVNDLVFFASCLQPDVPDEDKLDALEMLLRQTVDYKILQSKEASRVGTLARKLRTLPGEVGSMSAKVLEKWKELGWCGWSDFLPDSLLDSSEDENYSMNTDKGDVDAEEPQEHVGSLKIGQIQNEVCSEDYGTIMVNDSQEPTCREPEERQTIKGGRQNLREQKIMNENNFKNLISKVSKNGTELYKCMCGDTFETRARASRHSNICGKKRVLKKKTKKKRKLKLKKKCNTCGALFVNRKEMNLHKKKDHKNIEDSFKCMFPNCTSVFNSTKNFRQHIKTHTSLNRFKCPCCSKQFSQMGSRNRHVFSKHKKVLDLHAQTDPSMSNDLELIRREESGVVLEPKVKRKLLTRIIKSVMGGNSRVKNEGDLSEVSENNENYVEEEKCDDSDENNDENYVEEEKCDDEDENNDDWYLKLRQSQIDDKMQKLRAFGLTDFINEEKLREAEEKRKKSRPKHSNYPKLPTRKSNRLRGLNEGEEEELLVLAPDLDDYLSTVEPIPVMTLKELPKSVRSKAMPTIKIPSKDSNPPLPIRFYSCVPLPHPEDSLTNPKSPIEILENDDNTDHSLLLPVMSRGSLLGVGSKFDLQYPQEEHRSVLEIDPELQISESPKAAERPLHDVRNVTFFKASSLSCEAIKKDDEISSECSDGGGRFSCDLCPFNTANDNKDLKRHKNAMHKQLIKPVICLKFWCQKEFYTKYELKTHKKNCNGLKCPEDGCDFIFKWKHQVEPHKRSHASYE